jgi:ATP-dependent protease HslVU (ClpYQ) peptidase subunit
MTTIVAIQYKDKVVMGADSLTTGVRKYSHPQVVKITARNNYLIGGSGLAEACDIAQHIWKPPTPNTQEKKDLYHFMISKVIPSLKDCFRDNQYDWQKEDDDKEPKFNFLIAVGGQVFDVDDSFSVMLDDSGIYGAGHGSSVAIGAIHAGANIEKALEIAAKLDPYTAPPFIYFEQNKRG